nr:ribonuclease H-like domain-containing protein [Tanacetum cinerariifolium]
MTLDESHSPTKLSSLVDYDVGEEEAIEKYTKEINNNNEEDESLEVDKIVNIKESKNHLLDQDLVPLPISQSVIGTRWLFRNKLDKNGIMSRNKARLMAQGYNQQEGIDYNETYALVARRDVGNKMHKAFPLPVIEFPLQEESCHCQKKRESTAVKIALLLKSRRNCQSKSDDSYTKLVPHVTPFPASAASAETTDTASDGPSKKKGRTVTVTADDMQRRKNDVKARTTLLLSLPEEHQLRFKWLMHTIVWRNMSDLDTMSLDDLYNHLKVYESKVQKKSEPNPYNMAFISLAKHSRGNEDVTTASVSTASTNVPTASINVGVASISQDTACAYIASQFSGSQIKFEDINQIDEDDIYMANDKEDHALVADKESPLEFALMANTSAERLAQVESRLVEHREKEIKYCEKIRGLELDVEFKTNSLECLAKKLETLKKEKEWLDGKLAGFQTASKDLDSLLESQRLDKNKEGLGYSAVPPPHAQLYSSPKKDLSWTGLPEFKDDTVTDYSRPAPTVESSPDDAKNKNSSVSETEASPTAISPKSFIKFVKANDNPSNSKIDKAKTAKKPPVKYAEQYRKSTQKPNVRGNQRNWNNLKSHQLGPNFKMKKNACFNCGDFNHLAYDYRKGGSSQNNIDDKGYWDSGCSRHMTGNISYLSDYEPFDGGYVSFGQGGCKITGKGTIKTSKLEFENVYFVKDLKYNLFSVSQIYDNKNSILFTDLECIVLGQNLKLSDDDNVLLRTLRQHNMRLGHLNFKTMNKLVRHNLVRGLPTKCFENDHTCTACLKEKQHKASCTKDATGQEVKKDISTLRYTALPNWAHDALLESSSSKPYDDCSTDVPKSSGNSNPIATLTNPPADQVETLTVETPIPTVSSPVLTACFTDSQESLSDTRIISKRVANQVETPSLDNILTLTNQFEDILRVTTITDESNGEEDDVSNIETSITASPTPTLRIHKDHPKSQIISLVDTLIQTRNKSKQVLKNKKDERGIVIRNKARLVAQGYTQEEGIDYDKVFAPVTRIEAIRLFLAYASFMGFIVYQMDAFLYGTIDEETIMATSTTEANYVAAASGYGQVLWIQNQLLDYGDCFEKKLISMDHIHTDENVADLLTKPFDAGRFIMPWEAQFKGITSSILPLIETMEEGTKILATVDGILRTVIESSIMQNLKLNDEEGLSSLSDAELFENLTLMGYNISPNQKFTFQKVHQGEGSGTPTEPHHTPSLEAPQPSHTPSSLPTLPPVTTVSTAPIPTVTLTVSYLLRQYTRRARNAQSSALPPVADEPASPLRDVSQGEACPIDSGFVANQDRVNIAKTSTLPHDLQRQQSELVSKFEAQALEIIELKARFKFLEDRQGEGIKHSGDDAPIKGKRLVEGEAATERLSSDTEEIRLDEREATAERVSNDTEETTTVLTSMDAASVLSSGGVQVVPTATVSTPTSSGVVSTASLTIPTVTPIFAITTTITPYTRRKGKEKMVEIDTPKKKKRLQEQMDVHFARELEEELEREAQMMNVQIARDAEIARIHAEEELQSKIDGLDRSNEIVAKYLQEYQEFASELPLEKRIELISDLVRSNLGWKVKDFRGMTFEEIKTKFTTIWKQVEDSIPMGSKGEAEMFKKKGIRFKQESVKKLKTSEENQMHASVEWKLYDMCGVHQVTSKDKEIFMLVEKDYPLRKGLAIVMICYKLQVENYSQMANDLILKICKIVNCPSQQGIPTASYRVPTARRKFPLPEESCHCQKKREATAVKIALLLKSRRNCLSKSDDSYTKIEDSKPTKTSMSTEIKLTNDDEADSMDNTKYQDCETNFPAIIYNDASTSSPKVSSEPTVSIYNTIKSNINFSISFSDSEDKDYTVGYDEDSFFYKMIPVSVLKPKLIDDNIEINNESCSENIDIKPTEIITFKNKEITPVKFNRSLETNHNDDCIPFKKNNFIPLISLISQISFHEGKPLIFLIKNLYVSCGIPFDPKLFYKDGVYAMTKRRPSIVKLKSVQLLVIEGNLQLLKEIFISNSLEGLQGRKKDMLYVKRNKADLLGKETSKVSIEDEKEVSSNEEEVVEMKAFMALVKEERDPIRKDVARNERGFRVVVPSSSGQKDSVLVKSSTKDFTLPYQKTERKLPLESQTNTTNSSVVVFDSSTLDHNSADESSVYSIPFSTLEKLGNAEHVSEPKTIKSILKSCSTFKLETLKGIINEPSSAHAKDKRILVLAHAVKLKNVKLENDFPLANLIKDPKDLKL